MFSHLGYLGVKTHSYPVVSYINKDKANHYKLTSDISVAERLYSESVVWNNVEMEEVATVCLEGDKLPWEDLMTIIGPAIDKCVDIETTRQVLNQAFALIPRIISLGGNIIQPENSVQNYDSGKLTYEYTVSLDLVQYESEDGTEKQCYSTSFGAYFPFFAIVGDNAYGILDYQRRMYERFLKFIVNSIGTKFKLKFEIDEYSHDGENPKLKDMVQKLNSRK